MKNILEIDGVILNFGGNRVLSDVYLKCNTGEIVGILGRNGTGKTSLLRIIFGELDTPNKSIRINGQAISEPYRTPGLVSFLPQFNLMLKSISLKQVFHNFKIDFKEFTEFFPGFSDFYKKRLSKMSGGERRIVEIYTILKTNSMFCLLDEPFTHIMPIHVETINYLIEQEKQRKGIILIDHQYKNVIDVCSEIYIIAQGKTNLVTNNYDFKRFGYVS